MIRLLGETERKSVKSAGRRRRNEKNLVNLALKFSIYRVFIDMPSIFFSCLKWKALYAFFLFINRSSVNSSALCSGHRKGGLKSGRCWLLSFFHQAVPPSGKLPPPQFTRSLALLHCCCFWGLCLQLVWSLKPKTFQTAHLFWIQPIRHWASFTLEMFTLKKWHMFWKQLIQIKQT